MRPATTSWRGSSREPRLSVPLPLHTLTWGHGPRRILLLHGVSSSAAGWWRLAADLAGAGWEVIAPDLRGHGRSPRADGYSIPAYATDVLALGEGWDAALGHSPGGALVVEAHRRAPGWADRLILQDPALLLPARAAILEALLEPFDRPLTAAAVAAANPGWDPEDARIKAEALAETGPDVVRATVADNDPWNLLAAAEGIAAPTLLLGSDPARDGIVPVTLGEWLAATNPRVTYRVLEGAGHSAHREPATYDRYLAEVTAALG